MIKKVSFNHTTEVFDTEIVQIIDYVFCNELNDPKIDEMAKKTSDLKYGLLNSEE